MLADSLDDTEVRADALINVGTARYVSGMPGGRDQLVRCLGAQSRGGARRAGGPRAGEPRLGRDPPARVRRGRRVPRVGARVRREPRARAVARLSAGLQGERRARPGSLDRERSTAPPLVLREPFPSTAPPALALTAIGLDTGRGGVIPSGGAPLDEALALVEPSRELQRLAPVAAARAEAAWLDGEPDEDRARNRGGVRAGAASMKPSGRSESSPAGAGVPDCLIEPPPAAAEPYARQISGRLATSRRAVGRDRMPVRGRAGARRSRRSGRAAPDAYDELHRMGAAPAAAIVARRLRQRGARGLPRGPRKATRQNPAQLTARELEVLGLVAKGLAQPRDRRRASSSRRRRSRHHVSAILRKLDVGTRAQASAQARAAGNRRSRSVGVSTKRGRSAHAQGDPHAPSVHSTAGPHRAVPRYEGSDHVHTHSQGRLASVSRAHWLSSPPRPPRPPRRRSTRAARMLAAPRRRRSP